jgi:glycosyltransferase involved in cell wall biosynthesis
LRVATILFVESWTHFGGGQRLMLDLVDHLGSRGHTCAVALPGRGPVSELVGARGVEAFEYDLPKLPPGRKSILERISFLAGTRGAATSLGGIGRRVGAQLLFCMGGRPALPAVLAARRLGVAAICSVQLIYHGPERLLLGWCFRRREMVSVTFCSTSAAAPFSGLGRKGQIVPNWVSPTFLEPPLPDRAEGESVVVGVLGRISRTKGQRLFLEALLPLLDDEPRLRLAIGGAAEFEDPAEETHLRSLAAASGHGDRVVFDGSVDALAFLDRLDVLVVPSLWEEPFGLVAVEGMARGLPVVATRSGALVEIVADGETGLVVERGPSDLRAAVARLVGDAALRTRLGAAGRSRVEAKFSPAIQLPVVAGLVERAIAA